MPDFSLEDKTNHTHIMGMDEVGRGPWAGPVVAAGVIIPQEIRREPFIAELNDSKKLSKAKREKLFSIITETCTYGIGIINPEIIDHMNILKASFLAMERAYDQVQSPIESLLIDGNQTPDFVLKRALKAQTVIEGDSLSASIAAASILAKVTRDRIMADLHNEHPHYGWDTNSGYGTKAHQTGLDQFGITPYHRKSFSPIAKRLAKVS